MLQANEDRVVDPEGPMMHILLPARAQRLVRALGTDGGGWPQSSGGLRSLLWGAGAPLEQFEVHLQRQALEDEATETLEGSTDGGNPSRRNSVAPDASDDGFKAWLDKRLNTLLDSLERVGLSLVHDLPSCMLPKQDAINAEAMMRSARQFVEAAAQLPAKALVEACRQGPIEDGHAGSGSEYGSASGSRSPDIHFRSSWTKLLSALATPVRPLVPINEAKTEFMISRMCLLNARIVFCTVSSAGRGIMRVR